MPDIHLDSRDLFSWRLIIDEGLFIGRIVRHAEKFPNEAIALDITALPFIAVAVHDAIPFINKKLGLHIPPEDLRVTRIRHMTKSLSSNKMDFYDYLSEARAVIDQLNKQFYGGPFPTLLNRFRNNIGITYYGELPCYTTFSTVHLFTKDSPELLCSKAPDLSYEIGYHSGLSGGYLYLFSQSFYADRSVFDVSAFETRSNDRRFEDMVKKIKYIGCKDDAIFFFLSELLMLLVSVDVLFEAGFFTETVLIKYSCLSLDHVARALQAFTTFARTHTELDLCTNRFLSKVEGLIPREDKKWIKRVHPLRNAFMHYDFSEKLVPDPSGCSSSWTILDIACNNQLGLDSQEFKSELTAVRCRLERSICELIAFPQFDPLKEPWGM
jgi:hypothetical protein